MKNKITLSLAIFIIAGIIFTGCKKEASLTEKTVLTGFDYKVENGILTFETVDDYDKMLSAWSSKDFDEVLKIQEQMGFKSMYSEYKSENKLKNLPGDDIFFPLILSEDSKIKIGKYLFTFDFATETATAVEDYTKKSEEFSFDDDAIPYLFEGQPLEKVDYCNTSRINTYVYYGSTGYEGWVRYYSAVIYYSLYSEFDCTTGRMFTVDDYYWTTKDIVYNLSSI